MRDGKERGRVRRGEIQHEHVIRATGSERSRTIALFCGPAGLWVRVAEDGSMLIMSYVLPKPGYQEPGIARR